MYFKQVRVGHRYKTLPVIIFVAIWSWVVSVKHGHLVGGISGKRAKEVSLLHRANERFLAGCVVPFTNRRGVCDYRCEIPRLCSSFCCIAFSISRTNCCEFVVIDYTRTFCFLFFFRLQNGFVWGICVLFICQKCYLI